MSVKTPEDFTPEMQVAADQWYAQNTPQPNMPQVTSAQPAAPARWSVHLANDPFGGAAGQWAKKYYDDPNIDPGAAIQKEIAAFRGQYGDAAGQDDATTINMIATGQTPQAKQTPLQSWSNPATQTNVNTAVEQTTENKARADSLWGQLAGLASQSQSIDRNNPIVRARTDAFAAQQEKAKRDYITSVAERYGPYANIQGEERMAAEKAGQATGSFEADAMAQELTSVRDQILFALQSQGQFLSDDRVQQMNEKVAQINAQLGVLGVGLQQQGLNQDWQRSLMNNDLALRQLGLQDWDRQTYYDLLQRGLI